MTGVTNKAAIGEGTGKAQTLIRQPRYTSDLRWSQLPRLDSNQQPVGNGKVSLPQATRRCRSWLQKRSLTWGNGFDRLLRAIERAFAIQRRRAN